MRRAFTLIEILVVIIIIGIIASMTFVSLNGTRAKSRDAKRISDIRQIQSALEMYRNDHNTYPQYVSPGNALIGASNGQTYMRTIPTAPGKNDGSCSSDTYSYTPDNSNTSYHLTYCLGGAVQSAGPSDCEAVPGNICNVASGGGSSIQYDTGWLSPSVSINIPAGRLWNNINYAIGSDNAYTQMWEGEYDDQVYSTLLLRNFGISIPGTAVITGLEVAVERNRQVGGDVYDYMVKLVNFDGGTSYTALSDNKADVGTSWPTSDTTVIYGGQSDLWGATLNETAIESVNFSFLINVRLMGSSGAYANIDDVKLKVYYTN